MLPRLLFLLFSPVSPWFLPFFIRPDALQGILCSHTLDKHIVFSVAEKKFFHKKFFHKIANSFRSFLRKLFLKLFELLHYYRTVFFYGNIHVILHIFQKLFPQAVNNRHLHVVKPHICQNSSSCCQRINGL